MLKSKPIANRIGWLLTASLLLSLTLAACGGAPTVEAPAAAVESPTEAPTVASEAATTDEAPAEPTAAPTEAATVAEPASPVSAPVAECQSVDIPDNTLIAAVTDTDWAKGPANAPVTLIEYGDFQ